MKGYVHFNFCSQPGIKIRRRCQKRSLVARVLALASCKPAAGRDGADFRLLRGYDAAHDVL